MKTKEKILIILVLFLSSSILIYFETQKRGYHEDEIYSISSSVSEIWNDGLLNKEENQEILWKSREELQDTLILSEENKWNFKDVYQNQVNDVHPPFFYFMVHFVSMIFPNFYEHNIFLVNFIFFLLINVLLILICKEKKKEKAILPILIFYDFSMAAMNTFTFQRMYGMLTFFALLYYYLNLRIMNRGYRIKKLDMLLLSITCVGGFLTQYFFVIYALGVFGVMIYHMIKEKKKREVIWYLVAHFIAAAIGLLCFPVAIEHILFGGRGVGSFLNTNYFQRLKEFGFIIQGNLSFSILFICIFLILFYLKKYEKWSNLLLLPFLIYFFIIVQIVPFIEVRYIMLIFPFLILCLVLVGVEEFGQEATVGVVLLLSILGFLFHQPQFLYHDYKNVLNVASTHQEYSALFFIDNDFTYIKNAPEMLVYKQSKVFNVRNHEIKLLKEDSVLQQSKDFILRIPTYMEVDSLLTQMHEIGYQVKETIYYDSFQAVYIMEKNV